MNGQRHPGARSSFQLYGGGCGCGVGRSVGRSFGAGLLSGLAGLLSGLSVGRSVGQSVCLSASLSVSVGRSVGRVREVVTQPQRVTRVRVTCCPFPPPNERRPASSVLPVTGKPSGCRPGVHVPCLRVVSCRPVSGSPCPLVRVSVLFLLLHSPARLLCVLRLSLHGVACMFVRCPYNGCVSLCLCIVCESIRFCPHFQIFI